MGWRSTGTLAASPASTPTEAVANAITSHVRRAVVSAAGVTIDLGRRQRLFTGHATLAARLAATTCDWPGCRVPTTHCQTDHLHPWTTGGTTDQTNAAPPAATTTAPSTTAAPCDEHPTAPSTSTAPTAPASNHEAPRLASPGRGS